MITLKQTCCIIGLTSCLATDAQTNLKHDGTKTPVPFKQKDTTYWVNNFREFRTALFERDKTKAKAFFEFPLKNEGNEIWYLAYSNNEKAIDKLNTTAKPFTEKDFDKYFYTIFPDRLIKYLLKITMDELYRKGKAKARN